jgi:hypothetical protein
MEVSLKDGKVCGIQYRGAATEPKPSPRNPTPEKQTDPVVAEGPSEKMYVEVVQMLPGGGALINLEIPIPGSRGGFTEKFGYSAEVPKSAEGDRFEALGAPAGGLASKKRTPIQAALVLFSFCWFSNATGEI